MYIAINLVVALVLAAGIGFVFYKVRNLKSQIDLLIIRTAEDQVTSQSSSTSPTHKGTQVDTDTESAHPPIKPLVPAKPISWAIVSSINLLLGFLALFVYAQEYEVDFWFFAQSPTPALASVFLLYGSFTLLFAVYYAITAVNIQVKDSIESIQGEQTKKRAKRVLFRLQIGLVTVTALCSAAMVLPGSAVSNPCIQKLIDSATHIIAATPFTAWFFFLGWTYCSLAKEEGQQLRKDIATLIFALVMLLVGALVLLIVPALNGLDILIGNSEWLKKLLAWKFGNSLLLFLTTLATGLLLIRAFRATEIGTDKKAEIAPDKQSIRKQLLRPLKTIEFSALLALVVFAFAFNIISLSFFAERSLLATGFATQYTDTADIRQNIWTDERLGIVVDKLSYEEAILYKSEQWRILYKGTNASLISVKRGSLTKTFELPTSSPLLRFYREEVNENNNENTQNQDESGSQTAR